MISAIFHTVIFKILRYYNVLIQIYYSFVTIFLTTFIKAGLEEHVMAFRENGLPGYIKTREKTRTGKKSFSNANCYFLSKIMQSNFLKCWCFKVVGTFLLCIKHDSPLHKNKEKSYLFWKIFFTKVFGSNNVDISVFF